MKITIIAGDITKHKADVIVNSAQKSLMRSSGVSEAIHLAAGIELQRECQKVRKEQSMDELKPGQVLTTKAYNLPHKYVIHTVGPKIGIERLSLLYDCYENAIKEAEKLKANSISFPAIATNVNGVPLETSGRIVRSVLKNLEQPEHVQEMNFFFQTEDDAQVYRLLFSEE